MTTRVPPPLREAFSLPAVDKEARAPESRPTEQPHQHLSEKAAEAEVDEDAAAFASDPSRPAVLTTITFGGNDAQEKLRQPGPMAKGQNDATREHIDASQAEREIQKLKTSLYIWFVASVLLLAVMFLTMGKAEGSPCSPFDEGSGCWFGQLCVARVCRKTCDSNADCTTSRWRQCLPANSVAREVLYAPHLRICVGGANPGSYETTPGPSVATTNASMPRFGTLGALGLPEEIVRGSVHIRPVVFQDDLDPIETRFGQAVNARMQAKRSLVQRCMRHADHGLTGSVTVEVGISESGTASASTAENTTGNNALATCAAEALQYNPHQIPMWIFGRSITFWVPIEFAR